MPNEYDISRAFKRIENDLIDSMMRNMKRHQVEEAELGKEWEQWQAIQLAELEEYRKNNMKRFSGDFSDIQEKIDDMFYATYNDAQSAEEHRLMDRIKKGDFRPTEDKGGFFRLNEPKLEALIMATQADFARAEYAMLRRANDQYRQIIFDSMTYANITNDYAKAVDMATADFLKRGIDCIQYKGWTDKNGKYHRGARHDMSDYASMALRTGNKRAYLMGEGNAHDRYGLHTVRVNRRTQACPKCVGFLGRLLIDDVYGGGTRAEATAKGIPTLSDAMQVGFLHPNCKDVYSAYIEGVSQPAKPWSKEEIADITGEYNQEQQLKHAEDMKASYERMAKYSLDPTNQQTYQTRADNWQARIDEIKNTPPVKPVVPPTGFVSQIQFADGIKQEELIKRLDSEYINHTTQVLHGAHQAGGTADLGGAIRISNSDEATAIHEFAHQIASAYRTKVGLGREQDTEFWKELKKIHRKYLRETEGDPTRWISTYEHGTRDVSEFMAEAFTQQKMLEYGIPLPSKYGKDTTYSKQVLELIDKHYKRPNIATEVAEEVVDTFDRNNIAWSGAGKTLQTRLESESVVYRKAELLKEPLTETQIIDKISGADKTKGSCVSVALSYIGNKCGYDVLDFRDGQSRRIFSMMGWNSVTKLNNITAVREMTDTVRPVKKLLNTMQEGKQYLLSAGRHTSIVRVNNGAFEYLELQSGKKNGWQPFERDVILFEGMPYETKRHYNVTQTLNDRFGVKSSSQGQSVLVDIDEFKNSDEFRDLIGYINTAEDEQHKGVGGGIK